MSELDTRSTRRANVVVPQYPSTFCSARARPMVPAPERAGTIVSAMRHATMALLRGRRHDEWFTLLNEHDLVEVAREVPEHVVRRYVARLERSDVPNDRTRWISGVGRAGLVVRALVRTGRVEAEQLKFADV